MKFIKVTHNVYRYTRSDMTGFQVLRKEWWLCGVRVWSTIKDKEDVPSWAFIQDACLGYTDWKSRIWKDHGHLVKAGDAAMEVKP